MGFNAGNNDPTQPVQYPYYPYGSGQTTQYGSPPPPPYTPSSSPPKSPRNKGIVVLISVLILLVVISLSIAVIALTRPLTNGGAAPVTVVTSNPTTFIQPTKQPVAQIPPTAVLPTLTPTSSISSQCPSESDIANETGDNVSRVHRIQGWPCDFKLADGLERSVHCPGLFNASIEASTANGDVVIFWCPKGNTRSFITWGATLFDADIDPEGDACTVHAKVPGSSVDGKSC